MSFFQRMFVPFHVFMFRLSGGRLLGKSGGLPVLLLTTTGRKSGKQRTMPLFYLDDGGALAVSASAAGGPRHPAWYVNLGVNATVQVQTRAGKRAMAAEDRRRPKTAGGCTTRSRPPPTSTPATRRRPTARSRSCS